MAINRVTSIDAKIERAKEHIRNLESVLRTVQETHPYGIIINDDPKTGERVFTAQVVHELPSVTLGTIVGDVVHNLRSSLDHLVWQLVLANKQRPTRQTEFPISGSLQVFETKGLRKIEGISEEAVRLIEALKPYKGGNDALWRLHRLDITDKHRLLITVGAAHTRLTIHAGPIDAPTGVPRVFAPLELWPTGVFPVKDGTELARIIPAFGGRMYVNPEFTFEVAFGESGVFQGEPLIPSLHQLANVIEGIRNIFLGFLG